MINNTLELNKKYKSNQISAKFCKKRLQQSRLQQVLYNSISLKDLIQSKKNTRLILSIQTNIHQGKV